MAQPAITMSGRVDAGPGELLVDQQLLGRTGAEAVRRRPVRREEAGVGQRDAPLVLGQRGDRFGRARGSLARSLSRSPRSTCSARRTPARLSVGHPPLPVPPSRRPAPAARSRGAGRDARRAPR